METFPYDNSNQGRMVCTAVIHLWYNCRALAVTAIAVHRTIATAIVRRLDYG